MLPFILLPELLFVKCFTLKSFTFFRPLQLSKTSFWNWNYFTGRLSHNTKRETFREFFFRKIFSNRILSYWKMLFLFRIGIFFLYLQKFWNCTFKQKEQSFRNLSLLYQIATKRNPLKSKWSTYLSNLLCTSKKSCFCKRSYYLFIFHCHFKSNLW